MLLVIGQLGKVSRIKLVENSTKVLTPPLPPLSGKDISAENDLLVMIPVGEQLPESLQENLEACGQLLWNVFLSGKSADPTPLL